MSKRKALSKKLRFTVFARDGFQCQYCGRNPPAVILQVDHVVPVVEGGEDTEDNLITSCQECNQGKGRDPATRPLRPAVPERSAQIAEAEEQLAEYRKLLQQRASRVEEDVELIVSQYEDIAGAPWTLTESGKQSVRQWLRDWTVEDLREALSIAVAWLGPGNQGLFAYVGGILRKWRTEGRR